MNYAALAAALALGVAAGPCWARADQIPWGRADGEACAACHFMAKPVVQSPALLLQGVPASPAAGTAYRMTVTLTSPGMARAGFLIVARAGNGPAGEFEAADARTEADGDRLRSTLKGSTLSDPGSATWAFIWRAPARITGPVIFAVSANAGDDDKSPLGDVIHLFESR